MLHILLHFPSFHCDHTKKMANIVDVYVFLLRAILKLFGLRPQQVDLEAGTSLHFWVPNNKSKSHAKPSVVFLHGFGFNGILTWQFQAIALATKYDVYVPDFLFFGGSTTCSTDRSPGFQAECVAKGLKKLGVEKCSLVGFSYGGMVGFKMAEKYPDMVESMVVSCSVMALTESISRGGLERVGVSCWAEYLIPDTVDGVRRLLDIAMYKAPRLPNVIYKHVLEALYGKYKKERRELLDALVISDQEFCVARLHQKIDVVWGEEDQIFSKEELHKLHRQLGGKARVHCIAMAGHLVQVERPLLYNNLLKKILLASFYH